jgi:hypothetical protein
MKQAAKELVRGGRTNRRLYGGIYELSDGRNVYLAYRWRKEIFLNGEKSINAALDKGVACWAMDQDTLFNMRIRMIEIVGVYMRDERNIYITRLENFFDTDKSRIMNFERRGGALQRYLPLQYFDMLKGRSKI